MTGFDGPRAAAAGETLRHVDGADPHRDETDRRRAAEGYAREIARAGIADGARLLEIGFGHGPFLRWARDRGFPVTGTEISPALHAALVEDGFDVRLGTLDAIDFSADAPFDAVIAFDVFEHMTIPELRGSLDIVHGLLADGGHVLARFPNGASPFGLDYQHGDITHRSVLSGFSMAQLAGLTGFEVVFCVNQARVLSGGRAAWLKRLAFAVRDLVEIAVGFVYFGGRRVPLDPNLVCLLRKPG